MVIVIVAPREPREEGRDHDSRRRPAPPPHLLVVGAGADAERAGEHVRQVVARVVLWLRRVELGVGEREVVRRRERRRRREDRRLLLRGPVVLEEGLLHLLRTLPDDRLHGRVAQPLRRRSRRRWHLVPDRSGPGLDRRVAEARVRVLDFVWVVCAEGPVLGGGWRPVHLLVILYLRFLRPRKGRTRHVKTVEGRIRSVPL